MQFSITHGDLSKQKTDCMIVGVWESKKLAPAAALLDKACKGTIAAAAASGDLTGKVGSSLVLHNLNGISAKRVLLMGIGSESAYDTTAYCKAITAAFKALKSTATTDVVLPLNTKMADDLDRKVEQTVMAAIDAAYRYTATKKSDSKYVGKALAFHLDGKADEKALKAAIKRGEAIGEAMQLTKELGNLPPNIATPTYLAETAKSSPAITISSVRY